MIYFQFWYTLKDLRMENVGVVYGHLVILWSFGRFSSVLVYGTYKEKSGNLG
jgi:hypothetical protein